MLARSWIALLLLVNYLLVVGTGCISRSEDPHEFVSIRTSDDGQHYQRCRYVRMDGLEAFLNEALASRYQNAPETPKHHLISVINGIDVHYLPSLVWPIMTPTYQVAAIPVVCYLFTVPSGIDRAIYSPPRLG